MTRGWWSGSAPALRLPLRWISVLLLLVAYVLPVETASASGPAVGSINLEGRATLPASPCPTGCTGSFQGLANVAASGVNGMTPWFVAAPLVPVQFSYSYLSSCIAGLAEGSAVVHAIPLEAVGTYGGATTGGSVRDVVGFDLILSLDWLQLGSAIIIELTGSLQLLVRSTNLLTGTSITFWTTVIASGSGVGTGVFVGERVPECFGTGPPAALSLAASAVIVSTS